MKFKTKFIFDEYKGKQIWNLTPIKEFEQLAKDSSKQWEFQCVCGKTVIDTPYRVISGHKKSCGCMRYKNIVRKERTQGNRSRCNPKQFIGMKNNKLTVVDYVGENEKGRIRLKCICSLLYT